MWEFDHKEGWVLKYWCLWTVLLEKTLRVPWTARRSYQSVLKEINPEYSLEELMLKLKLQYFDHWCKELTHWKRPWCLERLKAEREGDDRGQHGWMTSPIQWTWVWASSRRWWRTRKPCKLQFIGSHRAGYNCVTEQQPLQPSGIYPKYASLILHLKINKYNPTHQWTKRESESESRSVVSNSLRPHGLHSPWNCPGQNTGVGSLSLLHGILQTQGSNPGIPHCR